MSPLVYHVIQIWLVLDVIAGLWLAYALEHAPRLEWHH